tara:strand:- start:502 stop:1065 length:564 start_codon:yes stop_codon:yes gene_type:complete
MKKKQSLSKKLSDFLKPVHDYVVMLNGSKIFAGLMIIVLQISSRFVTIRLSKTMESYLKYTFSRQILIFAIAWMGTRDIYVALAITLVFSLVMDVVCNEDSNYCMLPNQFKDYHIKLAEEKEDEDNIVNKLPGMPPTANNSPKPKSVEQKVEKTKIVTNEEIQNALLILDNAKQQNTYQSLDDSFFK